MKINFCRMIDIDIGLIPMVSVQYILLESLQFLKVPIFTSY